MDSTTFSAETSLSFLVCAMEKIVEKIVEKMEKTRLVAKIK